jgi:hypothetical protein
MCGPGSLCAGPPDGKRRAAFVRCYDGREIGRTTIRIALRFLRIVTKRYKILQITLSYRFHGGAKLAQVNERNLPKSSVVVAPTGGT